MTNPQFQVPQHLVPLTEGSPLSLIKLRAAWPAMPLSDKISVLTVLLGDPKNKSTAGVLRWKRHCNELKSLALDDANEYIRYFAALTISAFDKDEESVALHDRVVEDISGLVVSTQDHWAYSAFFPTDYQGGVERFWSISVPRRLAVAASMVDSDLSRCLLYAVDKLLPKEEVTIGELEDVVLQFLSSEDGKAKNCEELWRIVPVVPLNLSLILITVLRPIIRDEVPLDALEKFNEDHIQVLLARDDIALLELRRRMFLTASKPGLIHAAVSSARFKISEGEMSALFVDPKSSEDKIVALAWSCKGATLVQKQALRWLVERLERNQMWLEIQSERHLCDRSRILSIKALENEILEMRLFELAQNLTKIASDGIESIRAGYHGDLHLLEKHIGQYLELVVEGNVWNTYLNLKGSVPDWIILRRYLPESDDEKHLDYKQRSVVFQ